MVLGVRLQGVVLEVRLQGRAAGRGGPARPGVRLCESLVKPEVRAALTSQPYNFCDAPDCDTVYVSVLGDHLITKDMLTVRVGLKETDDPIPLCYCFGYDRAEVRYDIRLK